MTDEQGGGRAVIVAADLLLRARLEDLARSAGLVPQVHRALPAPDEVPAVLVLDLDAPDALEGVGAWRERWPQLRIVGFVSHVDAERRAAAPAG
ncbi:MAG: hypothetical protein WEB06_10225, partial [Actinomycetota bacterium]